MLSFETRADELALARCTPNDLVPLHALDAKFYSCNYG